MNEVVLSEVFGPTVQGEGPSSGRIAAFVRLGRCNLNCSWCDTPYTWDWKGQNGKVYDPAAELATRPISEVVAEVEAMNVPMVVITGGEPLLQRKAMIELTHALGRNHRVEVETNGTQAPLVDGVVDQYNVSPKLANSGIDPSVALPIERLKRFKDDAIFKFVVCDVADLAEIDLLVARVGLSAQQVWIMPEGTSGDTITGRLPALTEAAIERRYNITNRLHVQVWGNKRGV